MEVLREPERESFLQVKAPNRGNTGRSMAAVAAALTASLATAQPLEKLTVEDLVNPALSGNVPTRLAWRPDGTTPHSG